MGTRKDRFKICSLTLDSSAKASSGDKRVMAPKASMRLRSISARLSLTCSKERSRPLSKACSFSTRANRDPPALSFWREACSSALANFSKSRRAVLIVLEKFWICSSGVARCAFSIACKVASILCCGGAISLMSEI